jgi:phosphopantothenoylcysteine decarboxylase / phosphopantothenate---cysteine ligase
LANNSGFSSDTSVTETQSWLSGRKIGFICCGGIAAIESPRVARELRRYGATVTFFPTENSLNFVGKMSLEWSSGNPAVCSFSGLAPHIAQFDAILVSPATTNFAAKVANGICDDLPSTLIQSCLGQGTPVFAPAMHESLQQSPFYRSNIEKLNTSKSVFFIASKQEEGKHKTRTVSEIALEVAHHIAYHDKLKTQKNIAKTSIGVSLGGTSVYLDKVRCLTNASSGALGKNLVRSLYAKGYQVTSFECQHSSQFELLDFHTRISCPTYEELKEFFQRLNLEEKITFHAFFHLAAVSDYKVSKIESDFQLPSEKIPSSLDNLNVHLIPTEKLIETKTFQSIGKKFACKLTSDFSQENEKKVVDFLIKNNLTACFWNSIEAFGASSLTHEGLMVSRCPKNTIQFNKTVSKNNISEVFASLV